MDIPLTIRKAEEKDAPFIMGLIHNLAEYERSSEEVAITHQTLLNDGFGDDPAFECLVAEQGDSIVGMALYYPRYSTWKGKYLYLEDLVVAENMRGKGIGSALLDRVISVAKNKKAARLEWQVLDWNEPAIRFYEKTGATLDGEWINVRLTRDQMEILK